jgi:hypothetical protein
MPLMTFGIACVLAGRLRYTAMLDIVTVYLVLA